LDWLVHAAGDAGAAVVPAVDRSYVHQPEQVAWVYKRYAMAFGADVAAQLMRVPYINAGVFAVKSDSLLWQRWAVRFQEALDRWEGDFLSDQAVLNAALLHDGVPHAKLPSICNWICHLALPRWLSARRLLIEPSPPYASLLIVDNTLNEKHRSWRILDEHLRTHDIELAYSTIRGDVEPRTVHER
jgi:hypothetical protein